MAGHHDRWENENGCMNLFLVTTVLEKRLGLIAAIVRVRSHRIFDSTISKSFIRRMCNNWRGSEGIDSS